MFENIQYIETISYATGALATFLLFLLLLTGWAKQSKGSFLILATLATAIWLGAAAMRGYYLFPSLSVVNSLEVLRSAAWCLFIFSLLGLHHQKTSNASKFLTYGSYALLVVTLLVTAIPNTVFNAVLPILQQNSSIIATHLIVAVLSLFLVEQLYRNSDAAQRWALKYLCLGLASMFAYDVYLYSEALLFKVINQDAWNVRGLLFIIIAPLIAVSAARNPVWKLDVFVSRQVAFHTATLMLTGGYLLLMAAAGYYIQIYGGTWGSVAQRVFIVAAIVFLLVLLTSTQFRARLKVALSKHFYNYKYDYRGEWLRFNQTLSDEENSTLSYQHKAIQALAEILESPGGYLFKQSNTTHYESIESLKCELNKVSLSEDAPFIQVMREKKWVVNFDNYDVPQLKNCWLAVPLFHKHSLYGFVAILNSRAPTVLNWEDYDLLKTVADGVVNYLVQGDNALALMEARQFEAFHRLSAFVVHDLKNVSAQLSLIVKNAERHRDNPEFIDDSFSTIENAVARMNRMLAHLRQKTQQTLSDAYVDMRTILENAVKDCSQRQPVAFLESNTEITTKVQLNAEKFTDVIVHLIHNAQDATPDNGSVRICLSVTDNNAIIEVVDTGEGMDNVFIETRLFKPFDTTKGNAGMGIGAYEARDYIESIGGQVEVSSQKGSGTTFRISLPLIGEANQTTG